MEQIALPADRIKPVLFTPEQLDALDISRRHQDACIVAGPGSGKTTVLVEYFRRLIESGVDPLRVLAITFTEKAAGNMRRKLAEAVQDDPAVRARLERAWVSTIHGFCTRLLRENAVFAGVDPEFTIAGVSESWRMQREAMASALDATFELHPVSIRALIRGLSSIEFEDAVRSAYDGMRSAGVTVEQLAAWPVPAGVTLGELSDTIRALRADPLSSWNYGQKQHLAAALESAERIVASPTPRDALLAMGGFTCNLQKCKRNTNAYNLAERLRKQIEGARYTLITAMYSAERDLLIDILRQFDNRYRERKRQAGVLDFADLEEYAVALLRGDTGTRERLRVQFDHILMDELQDTNGQQSELLRLVRAPGRFYAVGDINQSIFGFRHAEPRGFERYREEVQQAGHRLVQLTGNFRSRPEILSAVETIVAGAQGIEPRPLVAERRFDAPRPVSVEVISVSAGEDAEAQTVACRMLQLLEAEPQFTFQDVALLVRNTEVLPAFTTALDAAGIPYLVNRGKGFYDSRDVNDLTHLLRVIANPRDEVSLAVVLRSPLVGASDEALLALRIGNENIGAALMDLKGGAPGFDPADLAKLLDFTARLGEWRTRREYVSFDRLLLAAIDDCGYPVSPNVDKFLAQTRDAAGKMSLDSFVSELSMFRDANLHEPDAPPEDSANAVSIMTVHSAKGLEFPVVFLAAMHKGIESGVSVVAFSPRWGLGARWRDPGSGKDKEKDDLFQHAIRDERKKREESESNRLLYVAMTRAEQHLVLSWSASRKPANWAKVVAGSLAIKPEPPRDEVVRITAPDGKGWNVRVLVDPPIPDGLSPRLGGADSRTAAPDLIPAPEISGQHDTNATVTALARFAACPREYYLGQYLALEGSAPSSVNGRPGGAIPASDLGTEVHAILAAMDLPAPHPLAQKLAAVFHQSALGRRAANASRVEREFDFLMSVDDLVVRGQVDLWFEEGAGPVIVDYKTDDVTAAEAHHRAQDYALQLRLYAMAVERVAGRPPTHAWLHFLRPNTLVEVDLAPSLLDSPEQIVREFQEAQSSLEFPLREGERCRRCEFFGSLCPSTYRG